MSKQHTPTKITCIISAELARKLKRLQFQLFVDPLITLLILYILSHACIFISIPVLISCSTLFLFQFGVQILVFITAMSKNSRKLFVMKMAVGFASAFFGCLAIAFQVIQLACQFGNETSNHDDHLIEMAIENSSTDEVVKFLIFGASISSYMAFFNYLVYCQISKLFKLEKMYRDEIAKQESIAVELSTFNWI